MAAVSTNGHTNMEGMKMEEFSEEDGYFTCAVSVQHKVGILQILTVIADLGRYCRSWQLL